MTNLLSSSKATRVASKQVPMTPPASKSPAPVMDPAGLVESASVIESMRAFPAKTYAYATAGAFTEGHYTEF